MVNTLVYKNSLLKDNIPENTLKKLKKYIDNPKFIPDIVEKTSKVCTITKTC